ncbi:MAG: hypothetical protein KIH01_03080 [Candidatus Freyarchaeota archaeon]|nr:hypothetical protein [Candidatus Jordarchaeia archaeon]
MRVRGILAELVELPVSRSLHVVVLTGAGVSAESGVPIFRGPGVHVGDS